MSIEKVLQLNIVDNEEAARSCLEILKQDDFITVDTEFIREHLKHPLLCLLQVSSARGNFVIDPFAIDVSFFNEIFESGDIIKVFHSAEQDIELLQLHGIHVNNIHDTQMYEMILDTKERVSYQAIVEKYLGKKLSKKHVLSDWKSRPLSQSQLLYSIEDVFYLRDVFQKQNEKLRELNRVDWLDSEMKELASENSEDIDKSGKNVYAELLNWVREWSERNNISSASFVSNRMMKAISKKGNEFVQKIRNSRYAKQKYMQQFLDFADEITANEEIYTAKFKKSAVFFALKAILAEVSAKSNIAASMIATSSDIERLISGNRAVECLSGWRKKIFGDAALSFLDGHLVLSVENSAFTMKVETCKISLQ